MSNDKDANSAGEEPRPETGQQRLDRLLAAGGDQSAPPETVPATTGRKLSGDELFAMLTGKESRPTKEPFTPERAKKLCKSCFGDTDVDGVTLLQGITQFTLGSVARFMNAVRDDEKTAAAPALLDLLGTPERHGALEMLPVMLALYGDYLPHGDPVRVPFSARGVGATSAGGTDLTPYRERSGGVPARWRSWGALAALRDRARTRWRHCPTCAKRAVSPAPSSSWGCRVAGPVGGQSSILPIGGDGKHPRQAASRFVLAMFAVCRCRNTRKR